MHSTFRFCFSQNSYVSDSPPSSLNHEKFICNQVITYSDVYSNFSNVELKMTLANGIKALTPIL